MQLLTIQCMKYTLF